MDIDRISELIAGGDIDNACDYIDAAHLAGETISPELAERWAALATDPTDRAQLLDSIFPGFDTDD